MNIKSIYLRPLLGILLGATLMSSCLPSSHVRPQNQNNIHPTPDTSVPSEGGEEGKNRFLQSFGELTKGGVKFQVEQGFYASDAKAVGKENRIDFDGAKIALALEGLSLHKMHLSIDAPLKYNGISRYLGVYLSQDELYFNVAFPSSNTDTTFSGPNLRYMVDTTPYIGQHDATVNGDINYQYGNLSWVIDNILSVLHGGPSSQNTTPPPSTSGQTTKIDWLHVLKCLDSIEETKVNGLPYFTLNLSLIEGGTVYPIGFRATSTFEWAGFDFPSATSNLPHFNLTPKSRIKIAAKIVTESAPILWQKPANATSYLKLENSLDLFKRIAEYIREQAFNINLDLKIIHHEDEIPGTATNFGRPEVDEGMHLLGDASVDMEGNVIDALGLGLSMQHLKGVKNGVTIDYVPTSLVNTIGLEYESKTIDPNRRIFATLNKLTSFRTNKVILDALVAKFAGFKGPNLGGASSSNSSMSHLLTSLDAIANQVKEFQKSLLYQGIFEGHYEAALDALTSIKAVDNQWFLTIDLARAGLSGTIDVVLSGLQATSLASLTFNKAKFAFFEISGKILIDGFKPISLPNKENYQELAHLPSITDQIGLLSVSQQARINFSGYMLTEGTTSTPVSASGYVPLLPEAQGRLEQGSEFTGSFALDLKGQLGSGGVTLVHRKPTFTEKHYIDADVTGPAIAGSTHDTDNQLYLRYHSDGAANKNPIMGRMSITSLNDLIDIVSGLAGNKDPRFERISNMLSSSSTSSLIGKIQNGYFLEAMASPLITSLTVTPTLTTITMPKEAFDMAQDMVIKLHFGDKTYHQDGTPGLAITRALQKIEIIAKSGASNIFIKLEIVELDVDETLVDPTTNNPLLQKNFGANPDKASFWDFSSASSLVEHLLGMITLGVTDTNNFSVYHIKGTVDLKFLGMGAGKVTIDVFIRLDGIRVDVYGRLIVPEIAVATQDVDTVTEFFYHTDGKDPTGTFYMRRIHTWTSWFQKKYSFNEQKVSGTSFSEHMLDWILFYMLSLSKTIYNQVHKDKVQTQGVNGEDALTSYSTGNGADGPIWNIGLDIAEIGQLPVSMTLNASIGGCKVVANSRSTKAIRTLTGTMSVIGSLIKMNPNLELANLILAQGTGGYNYVDGWNEAPHNETIFDNEDTTTFVTHVNEIFAQKFYDEATQDYVAHVKGMPFTTVAPDYRDPNVWGTPI